MEKIIRDNVHGEIYINNQVIIDLIDTSEFQRLRRIIQLGGGQFVFPSANHTRFSHCIGVYHVICKFLDNEKISIHVNDNEKIILKVAGLLHDIGHGPFSHSFENISKRHHEEYSVDLIRGNTQINQVLKKHNINPEEVISVIEGKHNNQIINSLVSSQLDADRLDYLLRDSINAGVSYSKPDIDWIIRNSKVIDGKLVFNLKTLNAIENFLLGRYHMFKQVYEHKISIAFDNTFKMWFKRLRDLYNKNFVFENQKIINLLKEMLENKVIPLEKYTLLDDYTMLEIFKNIKNENDKILSELSDMLINRRFLKVSSELTENQFKNMKQNFDKNSEYYFDSISLKDVFIYKVNKNKKDENIYIFKEDKLYNLKEVSEIIKVDWNDKTKKIFIFPKIM